MPSPFRIIFPRETWGESVAGTGYPVACRHRISIAAPTLTKLTGGEILVQHHAGYDYFLESWSINLENDGFAELQVDQFFYSLCLSLANRMILYGDKKKENQFPEKYFRLLSLSPGTYRLKLFKGRTVLFFIAPPPYHLRGLSARHPAIFEALTKTSLEVYHPPILTKEVFITHTVNRYIRLFEKISKAAGSPDFELHVCMIRILSFYEAGLSKTTTGEAGHSYGQKTALSVKQYILDNLGGTHIGNAKEICRMFNISDKTLRKEFIRLTSKTVHNFIKETRLEWGRQLLSDKTRPVTEVAEILGYSEPSNFIRDFKQYFGYPPGKEKTE